MGYSPHDVHVDDRPKGSLNGQQNTGFAVKRDFWPLLKLAGLRRIRFHDLRHTFATLWLDQGESPQYIQVQLGHASSQVTMDRYGHLLPDVNQQAARQLEDSLFGPSVRKPLESPAF
jgi:integrase